MFVSFVNILALLIFGCPALSDVMNEEWSDRSVDVTVKYYFFNITNTRDILNRFAKPNLKEVGPYSYKEIRRKVNITWNDEDKTISYRQVKTYYFQRDQSVGDIDDLITIPNIPLISIVSLAENYSETLQGLLAMQGVKEQPYVTKKVSELLFDGYFDPFVKRAQDVANQHVIVNNTFGFFVGQNDTDDGEHTVYTGIDDPAKFPKLFALNGETSLFFWKAGSLCNAINGTDSNEYVSHITKDDALYVWMPELGRSIFFKYESAFKHGDSLHYRFKTTFDLFADVLLNKDNDCFCMMDDCFLAGILELGSSRMIPLVFSPPHFFQSEPSLLQTVDGLQPNPLLHGSYLEVEPKLGKILNAAKRIQINVRTKLPKSERLQQVINIPNLVFPLFWKEDTIYQRKTNNL